MLQLPAVFSNHMVLQRNKKIRIWGSSDSPEVTICLKDAQTGRILENKTERTRETAWETELQPRKEGGPYLLEVRDRTQRKIYEDVYLGEVWLAGGQSNMEFELAKCLGGEKILQEAYRLHADGKHDLVRYYQVSRISYLGEPLQKAEEENRWQLSGEEGMADWSAVAWFFASKLAEKLGVMIGVIGCNWGGTSASCWMSRSKLQEAKETDVYNQEYDRATEGQIEEEYLKELEEYKAYQSVFDKKVGEYYRTTENPSWEEALSLFGENHYPGPMGPRNERRCGGLYESMLKRVMPYTLAGFLYYQAEEDDHRPYNYEALLTALIENWRADWKDRTLPFLYVLLPMFADVGAEDFKNWAFLREAQINVYKNGNGLGLASALDCGEYGNIHPIHKKPVGERLATIALNQVYGQKEYKDDCYGPFLQGCEIKEGKIRLQFRQEDGLLLRQEAETYDLLELKPEETADAEALLQTAGFEIAGSDGLYFPANVSLQNAAEEGKLLLLLSAEQVKEPLQARYLWTNYHPVLLYGRNGLPVFPFRTNRQDGAAATGSRQGYIKEKYEV